MWTVALAGTNCRVGKLNFAAPVMHEMSIAQNIVEIIEEITKEQNAQYVTRVVVEVGELVAVVPDSLQFCYQALTAGTALEQSQLIIREVPAQARCNECGRSFHSDSLFFVCPHCQSTRVEIVQGQELKIKELEVE